MSLTSKLKEKIASLREKWRGARKEIERLKEKVEGLQRERECWQGEKRRWEQERERLRKENKDLKRQLGEAHRASKRSAAPFSRGKRKENPQRPGRKAGKEYGQHHHKQIPSKVDEVIAVAPPAHCVDPNCEGEVAVEKVETQYQQEIVRRTIWRRFDIS